MGNEFYIHKIKSILKDNIAHRKQKGLSSGDLCHKNLYKIKHSPRIFEKKGIISKKKYNIALTMDVSGSLAVQGIHNHAANSCYNFIKDFQELCDLMVCSFNAKFTIEKSFKDKKLDKNELLNLKKSILQKINGEYCYGNHDGYALLQTYEKIKGLDGEKLIIMTTDGDPNCDYALCSNPGCHYQSEMKEHLKKMVHYVQSRGIPVIGFGLGRRSVVDFYPTHIKVNDASNFYSELCKVLNKVIKRKAYV